MERYDEYYCHICKDVFFVTAEEWKLHRARHKNDKTDEIEE